MMKKVFHGFNRDLIYRRMEEIYEQKIHVNSKLILAPSIKEKLISWFDNIDECIESFLEMGIYFE